MTNNIERKKISANIIRNEVAAQGGRSTLDMFGLTTEVNGEIKKYDIIYEYGCHYVYI